MFDNDLMVVHSVLSFDSKGSAKFETSIVPKCVGYLPFPAAKLWLLNSTDMGVHLSP